MNQSGAASVYPNESIKFAAHQLRMLKNALPYTGLLLLRGLSLLPLPVLYILAKGIYVLLYYIFKYRRIVVKNNLRNAFPERTSSELAQIEKKYFKYLAQLIVEIVKMSSISQAELQRRFRFKNIELLNELSERGESVVACSGHYGNWEWGTLAIGMSYSGQNVAIYRPLSNKLFNKWFIQIRTRFGNRLIAMRQTLRAIIDSKDRPTMFLFGNDQAPPREESHYWRTFLNQQTAIQQGMEKIALKTDRPIFYLKMNILSKGYYEVECVPLCLHPSELSINELTDLHVNLLEDLIREKPEYWLWSHKRWKHQPIQ